MSILKNRYCNQKWICNSYICYKTRQDGDAVCWWQN